MDISEGRIFGSDETEIAVFKFAFYEGDIGDIGFGEIAI